jgi:hypothetical protein
METNLGKIIPTGAGNWNNLTSYEKLTTVWHQPSKCSYVSKTPNTNKQPDLNPADWQKLADVSIAYNYAYDQGTYAKNQGDYAKAQGDYALSQVTGFSTTYLKLNQTTPQTTVGTFTFPAVNITNNLSVGNDINLGGYLTRKKSGLFVYLKEEYTTNIIDPGEFYPITGTFEYNPIENFTSIGVNSTGSRYDGVLKQFFKVCWASSVYVLNNNTTVTMGLKHNGVLMTNSLIANVCKIADEMYHISGAFVIELSQTDTLQLVVATDLGNDIKFKYCTAAVSVFF